MPRGSDYKGPREALECYAAIVDAAADDVELKGAKNPYTARNGHMFSFLDAEGKLALRLPDDLREAFLAKYESGPVTQYGAVMRGYVSVPADLLTRTGELQTWFDKSYQCIGTLKPKPAKK